MARTEISGKVSVIPPGLFSNIKFGRRVDGGVDRISQLPDEILCVILSFLRLSEAVSTSVLSSRWSHLWKHAPNLDFDLRVLNSDDDILDSDDDILNSDGDFPADLSDENRFIEIVNSVIQSHKALSLKNFRITFPLDKSVKCTVTKWLEFVFSRQVESLELDFKCCDEEDELVLEELLRESRICLQPQTHLIFFQSLKSLCLRCLKVSGEDIELFLHNCPLLEQLTIQWVTLTSDVKVCGATLMLKHLDIFKCRGEKSIKISAPNLTYIRFTDRSGKLLFENVPKLVEADFIIGTPDIARSDSVVQHFASSASCYFSQLQILNLNLPHVKTLCQLQVILANGFTGMPNLKKLVIFCHETYNHSLLPITALIWAYPRLEEFKLEYSDLRETQPAYMQVMMNVGRSPHQHLKVFELQMSRRQSVSYDIAELVTYISNNCVALRKIIIGGPFTPDLLANRYYLTHQLHGKVPNHIQLELFNPR